MKISMTWTEGSAAKLLIRLLGVQFLSRRLSVSAKRISGYAVEGVFPAAKLPALREACQSKGILWTEEMQETLFGWDDVPEGISE